ncbi:TRAP transporter small permease [Hydrogenophaga sp. PAMC20947]|uniref:TRAP transporter small permease n=1 Tax=Hydrogenophaga sp. PAMC20947 TaxID=2565558 RepID=UPI00109DDF82|nr:TRAP transporter small permease [Hydrogenophaga sp. PAMC20947]QCB47163.1 TRAP transporter small permease [Hydrogenophaga sp. PAMC20947]
MTHAPLLGPQSPAPLPLRLLGRLVDWTVIAIGATMATMVFFNVSLHIINKDLAWVTEFGELLLVWVTFLGGACAVQRGSHMSITEFIDKLNPAQRRWADAVVQTICLGMLVVLTYYGWNLVEVNWGNQLTVLGWPVAIQYMGMAVGSSLMLVFMCWDLWQILAGVPRDQRYPASE